MLKDYPLTECKGSEKFSHTKANLDFFYGVPPFFC
jgi:hypothetical protein